MAVYSAAKAAVAGFTQSLALELRRPAHPGERGRAGHGADGRQRRRRRARPRRTWSWATSPAGIMTLAAPGAGADRRDPPHRPAAARADGAGRTGRAGHRRGSAAGPGYGRGARRPRHGDRHPPPRLGRRRRARCATRSSGRAARPTCFAADLTDPRAARELPRPRRPAVRPARRAGQLRGRDAPAQRSRRPPPSSTTRRWISTSARSSSAPRARRPRSARRAARWSTSPTWAGSSRGPASPPTRSARPVW